MTQDRDEPAIARSGPAERDYLLGRADDHRERAEKAGDIESRLIHQRLEELYREQAALIVMVLPD